MYAGILRDKLTNTFAQGRVTAWTRVKAHQDLEKLEGTEWQHARGNYLADKGAAEAQGMHPKLDETQVGRLNKELEHAEAVLAVIGALWRHWPKLPGVPEPRGVLRWPLGRGPRCAGLTSGFFGSSCGSARAV